jgi:hypothetical protein
VVTDINVVSGGFLRILYDFFCNQHCHVSIGGYNWCEEAHGVELPTDSFCSSSTTDPDNSTVCPCC